MGLALGAWVLVVACVFGSERVVLWVNRNGFAPGADSAPPLFAFQVKGIVRPRAVEAGVSQLAPDEEVIGVEVDGRARAYRLSAFRDRSRHLVNDVIGRQPVSVAYCDINDCSRVYSGLADSGPIELSVAGLYQGSEMVLELGGNLFFQKSGEPLKSGTGPSSIPLTRLTPIRTTWSEWKQKHPETDVFEGVR